jgi:hypothetical protein
MMQFKRWGLALGLGAMMMTGAVAAWAQPLPQLPPVPGLVQPAWSLTGECYPIDFNSVDMQWYAGRGVYQLTVSGIKPYTNMEVSLSHQAYSRRPAYWRTVVVGCVKNGLVLPIPAPYYITMNLDQFVGTRGVEIVGASHSIRRPVPRS